MIQAMSNQRFEGIERPLGQTAAGSADFAELFGDATTTPTWGAARPAATADSLSSLASTVPASGTPNTVPATAGSLGDPNVQTWLNSFYTEIGAPTFANTPYQAAPGAPSNYSADSVYGPDQIYTQALYNQGAYLFANLTGGNPAASMTQLPGIPSAQAQQDWDRLLALGNAQRLATGQAIDTAAYWSDPGTISFEGQTYTAQELGYAGPGQSSGPEPIYISQNDQVPGTNTFTVPGYSGTVKGLQPNCYYTLQQLEQAGLKSGQPDAQYHPGSWSEIPSSS
jgi:hypothetical protein